MKTVIAALALMLATPAFGQTATDGDTIKLNGTKWRLWGIDAPELHQSCADSWQAGVEAKRTLERLIAAGPVQCEDRGRDRYSRSIGLCRAGGRDLGADMVSAGMAWAFTRYSSDYIGQEKGAISARIGVHAHDCQKPWDWREVHRTNRSQGQ
jgi:endonuclease YncB( thermonuclease family)